MQRASAPTLSFGQIYGAVRARHETAGFVISAMRPVGPPEAIPLHTHPEGSFTFILSGVQICSARNVPGLAEQGSLIWNPPGTTHRDRFQRIEDGSCLSISVPAALTESVALPEFPVRLESHEARGLVRAVTRECVSWDSTSPALAESLCLELLAVTAAPERAASRGGAVPRWLTQAQELLTERCTEPLTITAVAGAVGVHPAHLARNFSRFFRRSPGEHLRRSRVARAAALLRETAAPLAEIALACGFADQSHFTNLFRRYQGLPPAAFRSAHRSGRTSPGSDWDLREFCNFPGPPPY
ncbi:MAG TPA: helix-turn-helix domain-containing protein [Terriglobales bacterium]|nr:helix-turn-helix domain-containing protein [Terriglobales bacterium]